MNNRQGGFTLLEVMIALGIMAALAVSMSLLVMQVVDVRSHLETSRQQSPERVVDFMSRVDRQLGQLVYRVAHEQGQPLGSALVLQNNNRELLWVSGGQWVLPLQDHVTRLRLWRLYWDTGQQQLQLQSSGLLDAAGMRQWILVDVLDGVSDVNWAFYRQGSWQPDSGGDFPAGVALSLEWQGEVYRRLMLLPEVMLPAPAARQGGGTGGG